MASAAAPWEDAPVVDAPPVAARRGLAPPAGSRSAPAEPWEAAPVVADSAMSAAPAPASQPPRQVGVVESGLRTAGAAAIPVVRTAGLAAGGVLAALKKGAEVADVVSRVFGLPSNMTQRVQQVQDETFRATDERVDSMRQAYEPQAGEEFSGVGQFVGGVASMPIEVAGGMGLQRGIDRSAEVLRRGGTGQQAAIAGGVSGAANVAANLVPIKLGGAAARGLEGGIQRLIPQRMMAPATAGTAARVAGGAATGAGLGAATDIAVTGAENAALPAGDQFQDLQREVDLSTSAGLGAALGGAAGVRRPAGLPARAPAPTPATPGTQGSAGAAGTDMATQRRERARGLPVPFEGDAALTEGQATRAFEQQRFERETAKDPDTGKALRERATAQNAVALRNLDALEAFTGAQKTERGAAGQTIVDAIASKADRAKKEINAAYDAAREAGDMADPIDATPLAAWIEDNRSSAGNAGVISTAEAELLRLGAAQKAGDGSLVPREITINDLEEIRKKVVAGGKKDPTNAHFAGELNKVIDAATEGQGGELYKAARAKFRGYQAEFKERGAIRDLIGIKKGSSDRITATEKVLERAMRSADDLKNVRETLVTAGDEGAQAWREVQGQAVRKLRDEVTKNVALDERGNPIVSPAKIKAAIDNWDNDGRLEVLFGKKGAETMRDLRDTAQDLFTAPPGSVNTSNTASVMAKWFADSAASFVATGVPVPLVGLTKAAWKARSDRKVKKQVEQALGPKQATTAAGAEIRNPFEGSDRLPEKDASAAAGKTTDAAAAAPRETPADPRLQEIERVKAAHATSPETLRVLDVQAKRIKRELQTGKAAWARETEADALERAAGSTFEPAVRQALQARANELRTEKIPTGEAREISAPADAADGKPVPAGQAMELTADQAAKLAPTRREVDLLRLRAEVTDPEVLKDLDRDIAAERKRAADSSRAAEYLRLAERAADPDVRADFEARAKKLGAVRRDEPIPAGEAVELPVETIEPVGQIVTHDPTPEQLTAWQREHKFGTLDAKAAQDVDAALKYDAEAVKRAQVQHERQPDLFRRAIERIIEEGKARESQTEPPVGGSTPAAGNPGGQRPPGSGEGPGDGAAVTTGGVRPRTPDRPSGSGGAPRPDEGVAKVDDAAAQAATSPTNDLPAPTPAQQLAGNYKKGHVRIGGFDVSIENPKGSMRRSKPGAEPAWEVEMPAHYGYIRGIAGADGDHVDIFIGPAGDNGKFWVIDQRTPDGAGFDEHKVVTGVGSADEASTLYRGSFSGEFGDRIFGGITGPLTQDELRARASDLGRREPFAAGKQRP